MNPGKCYEIKRPRVNTMLEKKGLRSQRGSSGLPGESIVGGESKFPPCVIQKPCLLKVHLSRGLLSGNYLFLKFQDQRPNQYKGKTSLCMDVFVLK